MKSSDWFAVFTGFLLRLSARRHAAEEARGHMRRCVSVAPPPLPTTTSPDSQSRIIIPENMPLVFFLFAPIFYFYFFTSPLGLHDFSILKNGARRIGWRIGGGGRGRAGIARIISISFAKIIFLESRGTVGENSAL